MRPLEIGLCLSTLEDIPTGKPRPWQAIRSEALLAEELGFDTVWIPDELYWQPDDWPGPRGWWECVAMSAAVAASTSRIGVGTWVLSNLHRNPALSAKIAETLDEISGGRFLFGLGSGHAGKQGEAFGYPLDRTVGRFAEGVEIIVSLLHEGRADFDGEFYRVKDLEQRPRGPRPGTIPLMIGAGGPKMLRLAVQHADIWSWYATESSLPEAFEPLLRDVDTACEEIGRDPSTLGRSIGVFIESTDDHSAEEAGMGVPIAGSVEEMAETIRAFAAIGVTRLELLPWPAGRAAVEALAPVLEALEG
jgi:alkanesulfonate monooxygenase SsuD/methylene tetrahydromethanopterin reductase-like flavin-dependent oxidoreductase (luciferase family)